MIESAIPPQHHLPYSARILCHEEAYVGLWVQNRKKIAPGEARTHGLQIMRLTRCLLRYRGLVIVRGANFYPNAHVCTPILQERARAGLPSNREQNRDLLLFWRRPNFECPSFSCTLDRRGGERRQFRWFAAVVVFVFVGGSLLFVLPTTMKKTWHTLLRGRGRNARRHATR